MIFPQHLTFTLSGTEPLVSRLGVATGQPLCKGCEQNFNARSESGRSFLGTLCPCTRLARPAAPARAQGQSAGQPPLCTQRMAGPIETKITAFGDELIDLGDIRQTARVTGRVCVMNTGDRKSMGSVITIRPRGRGVQPRGGATVRPPLPLSPLWGSLRTPTALQGCTVFDLQGKLP